MSSIQLSSAQESDVTVISNYFIDDYMPAANGSYVKVYLYLLRCLSRAESNISITAIADRLEDSEKDINRALNYWEKVQLLSLERTASNEIIHITINDIKQIVSVSQSFQAEIPAEAQVSHAKAAESASTLEPSISGSAADKPLYSPTQVAELTNHDEVKWLLKIVEVYLERFLKPTDIQLILYLYESVGFSVELIMYLYEYCISKNKKKPAYIEAVALSWAEQGIDTVEKAELNAAVYNTNYNAVNKSFGLNRALGSAEKQYINKWLNQFGFNLEIITEACNRTILMTQKPDFKYADRILENWSKNGVHHLNDIQKLDETHSKSISKSQNSTTGAMPKTSNNKFNAFPQRNYTKEDYSAMEQRLLNSTRQ